MLARLVTRAARQFYNLQNRAHDYWSLHELIPPPALPRDLKAKKMSIKDTIIVESSDLVQELEDQLFAEGLVDLNEDPFSLDI